ncbi:MAG: hypothetical protein ABJB05_01300 [Parafilimonas sp.]
MFKYFLAWFPMLLLAVLNGTLRDLGYKKFLGDLAARQISTITLIILFAFYTGYIINHYPPSSSMQAMFIGLFWVVLTLCFEFGFGRMRGNSWPVLLADYNIFCGRIWVLVPIWILIAPYIFYRMYH